MNDKEIRQWHLANGIEYIEDDWGPRSNTGETDAAETSDGIRIGDSRVLRLQEPPGLSEETPAWEHPDFQWPPVRTNGDQHLHERLEDFFEPYIALLPTRQGELVRQVMNDQLTFEEAAEESRLYDRSHARRNLQSALRALTRLIAEDDPKFTPVNRPRDYDAETAAAERVFDRYMKGA